MYDNIETYFQSDDLLDVLLEEYKVKFKLVEEYWDSLQKGEIVGYEAIDETLMKLTGLFMELNVVAIIADVEVQKKKAQFNLQFTNDWENDEKKGKVIQSSIDRQVDLAVQPYRRVRDLFMAYRDSCAAGKECSQSRMKTYLNTQNPENKNA